MKVRVSIITALCACAPAFADAYLFTLNNNSIATWSASFNAPFVTSGDPRSIILGNYDAVTNPGGTRTIPGLFTPADNGLNNPINITAGGVSSSGSSGGSPLTPAGAFSLSFNTAANTVTVSGLSLDLLNGGTISAAANVSITYQSFRTRQPTCTLPGGFPINVPLGNAEVTALTAVQQPGAAGGTLTPTTPGEFDFEIPMIVDAAATVTLGGIPQSVPVTPVPIVLNGHVALSGNTATLTASTTITNQQTQAGPITPDPIAFDEPLCTSHLMLHVILAQVDVNLSTTLSMVAGGVRTCTSPSFSAQPQSTSVAEGADATFSVTGAGTTLAYQWRRGTTVLTNGPSAAGAVSGATTASITIAGCTQAAAGTYTCVLTNACGVATSNGAQLSVTAPLCDSIDFNGDGLLPDIQDIDDFIVVFGGGACPTVTCGDVDFNNDGLLPDTADIEALIRVFAGGAC